jgi:hypothetical protein
MTTIALKTHGVSHSLCSPPFPWGFRVCTLHNLLYSPGAGPICRNLPIPADTYSTDCSGSAMLHGWRGVNAGALLASGSGPGMPCLGVLWRART